MLSCYTLITLLIIPILRPNRQKLVLPKWHKYGTHNRVIRVCTSKCSETQRKILNKVFTHMKGHWSADEADRAASIVKLKMADESEGGIQNS